MEKAMRTQTRPWSDIAGFYRNLIEEHGWGMQPILALVESLATAPWAGKLHGTTSHATLLIAPRTDFLYAHDMLRVDYVSGDFVIVHFQTPWEEDWTLRTSPAAVMGELERFARSRGWV